MASTIQSIGDAMGEQTSLGQYGTTLREGLNDRHWDSKRKQFGDRSGCGPAEIEQARQQDMVAPLRRPPHPRLIPDPWWPP